FSSHKLVASLGDLVAESDFLDDAETLTVDLDIEAIRYQRRIDSTFRDEQLFQHSSIPKIDVEFKYNDKFQFERPLNQLPFLPKKEDEESSFILANELQVKGLMQKLNHLSQSKIVVGISGGLDSALALLVAHQAMIRLNRDPKDIIAVTMPAKVTSKATKSDALNLMNGL